MKKKNIRVAGILIKDGRMLVALSKYGNDQFYLCPGGEMEGFENLTEAVKRELKEETNYDVEVGELLYAREWINPEEEENILDLFFLTTLLGGEETHLKDPALHEGVIQELRWIEIAQLHTIDFEPKMLIPHLQKDYPNNFKGRTVYIGASR